MCLSCSAINIRKFDDHERWAKIEPGLGISSIGIATEMNVNGANDHVVSSEQINEPVWIESNEPTVFPGGSLGTME